MISDQELNNLLILDHELNDLLISDHELNDLLKSDQELNDLLIRLRGEQITFSKHLIITFRRIYLQVMRLLLYIVQYILVCTHNLMTTIMYL